MSLPLDGIPSLVVSDEGFVGVDWLDSALLIGLESPIIILTFSEFCVLLVEAVFDFLAFFRAPVLSRRRQRFRARCDGPRRGRW